MVDIAAEKGTLTVDEVKGLLKQMDEEEEFDDIELDPIALIGDGGQATLAAILAKRKRMTSHGELPWLASDAQVVLRSAACR